MLEVKRSEVNRDELSPMMQQYMEIKDQYEEEILFFRLGDFYELFFEDGILVSHELELTLTGKNAGLKERVPMCGVPFHSVKPYLEKLVDKGYKVAICEQLEDPKETKGMVKRGVVQVVSKGTLVDLDFLKEYDNNYIGSILDFNNKYILTYADVSTGHFFVCAIEHNKDKLLSEVLNLNLKAVVLADNADSELINTLKNNYGISIYINTEYLENQYQNIYEDIKDIHFITGIKHLLYYLVIKELKDLSHVEKVEIVQKDEYLNMDIHTIRNLELFETLRLKERTYSLIWLLDKTKTAMGSRCLKHWMQYPLKDKEKIEQRYDQIEILNNQFIIKEELRKNLFEVYDLERLCAKVICGVLNARDVIQIRNSLKVLPNIIAKVQELKFNLNINDHVALYQLLEQAIVDNPPLTLKEGSLIKEGYNTELDELRKIRSGGKEFISSLENSEKERTGIKNLKVGYNKVFGYYIEISKGNLKDIDDAWGWERRQTLTNCERFITPLLKEKEALVLNAEEKIVELEYNLFLEIKDKIKAEIFNLKQTAEEISKLDAIIALSVASEDYNLVKPQLVDSNIIKIKEGRHPVVERVSKTEYISNDCIMDESINTLLITGPNMSGKSTYMRQLAIIIIMAQMGSFVPAKSAVLPIFDKIFTRIGASDDLVSGESTFMVEMLEACNAILNATPHSLILFDELGRGTATYDGMSIAEAILEYINKNIKCKTLFSTHYHELTTLDKRFTNIKNVHVSALEENGTITFLHKIKNGAVDKSYGIHVAKLAGMPKELLKRANEILNEYEKEGKKNINVQEQLIFDLEEEKEEKPNVLVEALDSIDPLNITPMEALNTLYDLKQKSKEIS